VRRTYSNYGEMCFAAAGPKLPADQRQADTDFMTFIELSGY